MYSILEDEYFFSECIKTSREHRFPSRKSYSQEYSLFPVDTKLSFLVLTFLSLTVAHLTTNEKFASNF